MSGSYIIRTTNGGIDVNLPSGSDIGFKVNVDTGLGSASVNLPNMSYDVNGARTKIGETTEYSSKAVKIEITAETTIGSITLR